MFQTTGIKAFVVALGFLAEYERLYGKTCHSSQHDNSTDPFYAVIVQIHLKLKQMHEVKAHLYGDQDEDKCFETPERLRVKNKPIHFVDS